MKKSLWGVVMLIMILFSGCSLVQQTGQESPKDQKDGNGTISTSPKAMASKTMSMLKQKQFGQLAEMVHPNQGLTLSPYPNVDTGTAVNLSKNELVNVWTSDNVYMRGYEDGSGRPINLTFSGYYDEYIYNADFISDGEIVYDDVKSRGNMINNIKEVWPGSYVVEYHIKGTNPEYDGMDWKSLYLVYIKDGADWYLRAIVHSQWTI